MATALIGAVKWDNTWRAVRRAVKEGKLRSGDGLGLFVDMALFSEPIPMRLVVRVDGFIVAHSEIRDLGTARYGIHIAGLSNTIVTPGFRHKGIYTALIILRNIILDHRGQFLFAAVRVKKGYERRYMAQYPGFMGVKDEDKHGAAWLLRPVAGNSFTDGMLMAAIEHLEGVGKW